MNLNEIAKLKEKDISDFFWEHRLDDPKAFALTYHGKSDVPIRALAEWISVYQKSLKKFPSLKDKRLLMTQVAYEQSSGELTALNKRDIFIGASSICDLSAGLGMDMFFLRDMFQSICLVEQNPLLAEILRYNREIFQAEHMEIIHADSMEFLKQTTQFFDWIYVDPDRRVQGERHFFRFDEFSPNILDNWELLTHSAKKILIKSSPMMDIDYIYSVIPSIEEIRVVSLDNEIKEINIIVNPKLEKSNRHITAELIRKNNERLRVKGDFKFYPDKHVYADKVLQYIYDPDKSLVKSKLSEKLAYDLGIVFVNRRSQLLTSDRYLENFMGRAFKVINYLPYKVLDIHNYIRITGITHAVIFQRDFPVSNDSLYRLFKLRNGQEDYLIFSQSESLGLFMIHAVILK